MKTNALLVVVWLSTISAFAIEKQTKLVLFDTDKHELKPEACHTLDSLIAISKNYADFEIRVAGHTDDVGDVAYNKALSERRAKAVKDYFTSKGIEEGIIAFDYFGESRLLKPQFDATSRQWNRRVEITLTNFIFSSVDELDSLLKSRNKQYFVVQPNVKTLLKGKSGTKILVNKTSLVDKDGNPITEPVELQLIEALTKDQFLTNGLLTVSDGKLLESGGMLNLQVKTVSGKEVTINPDDPLVVQLPTAQKVDDMLYFTSTSGQNWTTNNVAIDKSYSRLKMPKRKYYWPKDIDFQSTIKHPIRPSHPTKPHKPMAPKQEMFSPMHGGLFSFLQKDKLEAEAKERYNKAYNNYLERYARYEKRLEQYQLDVQKYYEALKDFEHEESQFESRKAAEFEEFKKSPAYVKYFEFYDKLNDEAAKQYAKELEVYYEQKNKELNEWSKTVTQLGKNDNIQLTQNYVFQANTLNWINCDRFMNQPMKEVAVTAQFNGKMNDLKAYVIFEDINAIIGVSNCTQTADYKVNIPKSKASTFFAFGINKKGQTILFEKSLTGVEDGVAVSPKVCKLNDIVEAMQKLS